MDGQLVRTKFINGNLGNTLNTAPVTIGATANGAGEFFQGVIDEVSIYNRALSGPEIQSIYLADSAGKCSSTNPPSSGAPVITSFNPIVATPGSSVTLSGVNFSAAAASNIVYFGAVRAAVTAASANSLTVTVPIGATLRTDQCDGSGANCFGAGGFLPSLRAMAQTSAQAVLRRAKI